MGSAGQDVPRGVLRDFSLEGKCALVTGASRGLGAGMARALAEAGATVALVARDARNLERVAAEIESTGGSAFPAPADLAAVERIQEVVAAVEARTGRIDILLNAAGMTARKPVLEITEADFDAVVGLNLKALYFASQAVARGMVARGAGGKIIHIASLTSTIGIANTSVYSATKSGILGLTRTMAIEWAPHHIQVNAIAPGYYLTDLTRPLFEDPERRSWILSRIPAGRAGEAADLAGAVVFLASAASNYITGELINVDGGWLAS